MELLQLLIITTLITNVIVLVILFAVYQSQRAFFDIGPLIKKVGKLQRHLVKKEEKVLEEALEESKSSVEGTLRELKGIEEITEETKRSLNSKADALIQETLSKYTQIFQNITKDIGNSYESELQGLNNLQQAHYLKILEDAKASIEDQVRKLREEVVHQSNEIRGKVEEEMGSYKEKLKSDLDQRVFEVLSEVARETLGASVDLNKHQELVMKSLQRAKEEKLF